MNAKIWGRWVSRLFHERRRVRGPQPVRRRLAFESLEDRVVPATINWTGGGTNANWANVANWNLGRAPLAGDDLIFGTLAPAANRTTVDNLDGLPVFNSITIAASGYVINGSPAAPLLALGGSINAGSNLGTLTISIDMRLVPPSGSPQQTFTVNTGTNLVLGGHLSGNTIPAQAALQTITKAGPGTLELTNDNSAYTGAFTLASNGGVVLVSHPNAVGLGAVVPAAPTAGTVTVNSNSQLQLRNIGTPVNARLTLNGTGVADNGALLNIAGNNVWGGPVTLDSDASIGAAASSSVNITGLIDDTGSGHNLTKEGPGRLILGRVGGNTYRGQTIIDNGTLTIRDPLSLGAGADPTKPQSGTPQASTIVNTNSVTGESGTLQFEHVPNLLPGTDPSAILQHPALPFHSVANPVVGFQVFGDLITLNGPGIGNIGALNSLTGRNGWNGDVILGSPPPAPGSVSIGAGAGSELVISGVVRDPNRQPTLNKVLPGKVVLNNENTYRGGTIVQSGTLNIRDSRALGEPINTIPPTGPVSNVDVRLGASLELEVDSGLDGTPQRTHNRNLGFDSVRGDGPGQEIALSGVGGSFTVTFKGQTTLPIPFNAAASLVQSRLNALSTISAGGGSVSVTRIGDVYRVLFNGVLETTNQPLMTASGTGGATAVINAIYGLTVVNDLQAAGTGFSNAGGALRSVSGINFYTGRVGLGDAQSPALGSVGADRDLRPGHDSPTAEYFDNDHSLTVTGTITNTLINPPPVSTLVKMGAGHVILPRANTYTGPSEIREGWVTVQDERSLGTMNPVHLPNLRPFTTISNGAAVHLKPLPPAAPLTHTYELNGSFADESGGPSLTPNGGTLTATGYLFGPDQGLTLSGALIDGANYSIELTSQIDDLVGASTPGWVRLVDFKDRQSDFGLYSIGGFLTFYDGQTSPFGTTPIPEDVPFVLLLTRDGTTNEVVASIDGIEQFRFTDSSGLAVFDAPGNVIHIDLDNNVEPFTGEASGGFIDRLVVADGPAVAQEFNMINNFVVSGSGFNHDFGLINNAGAIQNIAGNNTLSGIIQFNGQGGLGVEQLTPPAPGEEPSQLTLTGHTADAGGAPGGITKLGSRRLIIQAPGTYTGDVDIKAGVLLAQNDTALGIKSVPSIIDGSVQGLVHSYELNGSFNDTLGGPPLTDNGGTLNSTNYTFGPGQGLQLSGALPADNHYSIEMVFRIDSLTGLNGSPWVNLIEFKDGLADTGLYSFDGALQFYDVVTGPSGAFAAGQVVSMLISRDGATKEFVGYVNGIEQIRFIDDFDEAVYSGAGNIINFLIDDQVIPDENAAGMIDRIRIFDRPLSPGQLNPSGNVTVVQPGAALEIGNSVVEQTGGLMGGLNIWGEHLVLHGQGNALFGDAALTILSDNSGPTALVNNPVFATDNAWRGPITLGSDTTIEIGPASRLVVTGAIGDALNPLPSGSSLTVTGGGVLNFAGANTYRGSTIIQEGVLSVADGQALGTSGNAEIQTLDLAGLAVGSEFTLTFKGKTTGPILYTGDGPTDAAAIQTALSALASIGGQANIGGAVAVTPAFVAGTFDVELGGSLTGFDQPMMIAGVVGGFGVATVTEKVAGSGGTEIADGASLQLIGAITVAGEPLLVHGTGGAAPSVPTQWFQVGPEGINNGQTPGAQRTTGRITSTVADPRDPNVIYVGTAGGGAWKTIDGGRTWRPLFDAIPEIQSISVGTGLPFTLSFEGEESAPIDPASPTLAEDIQSALNALATIGGAGAHVVVSRTGLTYRVTFGGTLIGTDVARITSNLPEIAVTTVQNGKDPRFAMYVGSITMHPINPLLPGGANHPENQRRSNILYLATGEANATGETFYGTGIYRSIDGGATWDVMGGTVTEAVTVRGLDGTFNLTFDGETTIDLPFNAIPGAVANALNDLQTIGGVGGSVTVTQTPIAEVQRFTVFGAAGTFTLTFNGQTTAALAFNATAAQVQAALEALTTIGAGNVVVALAGTTYTVVFTGTLGIYDQTPLAGLGTGGTTVTAVQELVKGGVIFNVTFGGTLAGVDVGLLTTSTTGSTTASVTITSPFSPFDGQVISKVVVDPFSGTLYAATGDAIPARNEVQQIRLFNFPVQSTFTLTITLPDANGNMVTETTAAITINFNLPAVQNALAIQNALNALSTINVISGNVTAAVSVVSGTVFNVTFGRNLAGTNVPTLVANPGFPPNGTTRGVGIAVLMEGGVADVNGTNTNAPGIWRLQGGEWVNLTSIVSAFRSSLATTQQIGMPGNNPIAGNGLLPGIPGTPGPDDDYRMEFPQVNATWTDLALIYTDATNNPNNGAVQPGFPILYAALGTTAGTELINNAVYWTEFSETDTPIWYVGDPGGSPFGNPPMLPTTSDARNANGFPKGQFAIPIQSGNNPPPPLPEIGFNGNIRITGVPIAAQTTTELVTSSVFAVVSTPDGQLRSLYRTTTGGQGWTALATPAALYSVGNFSNAILAANANTVFLGGQGINAAGAQTILMTTDGGGAWTDISTDSEGNGPHAGIHSFSLDSQGRLLVATDGGLWRRETSGIWTNLNGDLAISQMNGVASDPTRTTSILGGAQANGVVKFDNALSWTRQEGYGGGPVAIDPNNNLNLYAVSMLTGTNANLRKSVDGGLNWTTSLIIGSPTAPLVLDPVNTSRILVGGVFLRESLNQGTTWTDLQVLIGTTRISNVRDFAIANAQGLFAVDPGFLQVTDQGANAYDPDTIYVTDGNVIWVTKNHGQTWVNRTGSLTGLGSIVDIIVDPRNRDTVYAVRSAFGSGSSASIFRSTDAGRTWTNISSNLPNVPAWKIVVDPRNNFLYVGTDNGVFHSTDGGTSWRLFGVGMPNVQVKDIELNLITNTLLAGTYGRSAYQLFLDTEETSAVPISGVIRALGGSSVWAGNVILDGDAATNSVTVGAYGVQDLPNSLPVASINFIGPISDFDPDRPGAALAKFGQGDVILSGDNIYSGRTTVEEGALVVDNTHALGLNNQGTIVVNGAVLELRSNLDPEPVTLNGHGFSFNDHFTGSLRNVAGANTYTGPLTLNTDATIGVDSGTELTIAQPGSVNGTAILTKESTGTLVLAGANSTFSGATRVNQGVVRLENTNALGTTSGVRVLAGAQVQLNSPAGGPPVEMNVPLQLSGTGIFGTGALLNVGGDNAWDGPITLDTLPGFSATSFPNGTVAFGSTAGTLAVDGAIAQTDAVGITKVGPGRVLFNSPANGYSGSTEVLAGTLAIGDPGALGTRTTTESIQRIVTLSAERLGTFRLGFNGLLTGNLNWAASIATVQNALNALPTIGGVGGTVTVTRAEIQTTNQDGPIPLQGGNAGFGYVYTITFGGSLIETTLPLSAAGQGGTGAAASVVATGGIVALVEDGATLELATPGAGFDVNDRELTLNGAGVNDVGALFNSAGDNTWSGGVVLASNASIGAAADTSVTLDGGVTGLAADLTKVGEGTLNFPTASPPNAQARTIVTEGTVDVDGGVGDVVLDGGTLAGTGQVGFVSTTSDGGTINPGDTADPTGTLSSDGGLLDVNNTFFVDLVDATTADNDLVFINDPEGTIDLGFATLDGTTDLNIQIGDQFTILQTTNPNGVRGQFAGFETNPEAGGLFATIAYINGVKYVVDYFTDHVVVTRELANVAITLTPAIPNPVYGQPETFTAILTPEPGAPPATGVVTFTLDGNDFVAPIVNGVATFNATETNPLSLGSHTISVAYSGIDENSQVVFNPTGAGPLTVIVAPAGTTTTIAASVQSPVYGQSIIFTATVTSIVNPQAPNTLIPQGSVSFFRDGGIFMGTGTLDASGVATFNTSTLNPAIVVGSHTFQAVYNSDGTPDNYDTSSSPTITRFVSKSNTVSSVTTSGSPTVYGQPITFTATVNPVSPGSGVPTGIVNFRANGALLGTGTLNALGIATFTTTAGQLAAGAVYNIVAQYAGDGNFNQSAASTSQTVTKANSTTSLTSSVNPSVFGQPVTFTATIAGVPPGGGPASGIVTFRLDGAVIGTGTVNPANNLATYTTTFGQLPLGTGFTITAEYAGDNNFNASSDTLTQDVINAATTTAVASSANPSVFGQPVTFTATVTPVPPGAGAPSGGTVTFVNVTTGLTLGTVPVDANGLATITTSLGQLNLGSHTIQATFSGHAGFSGSAGTTTQNVNQASTTTTVAASLNPSGVDQAVTFTATVSPAFLGGPTGTVTFRVNGNLLGTGTLSTLNGVTTATFIATPNSLPLGSLQISAAYSGDVNFLASSGLTSHTVLFGTATALTSSANPSAFGQPVTFTATVTPTTPGATPVGQVTFSLNGVALGTVNLNAAGVAVFTTGAFTLPVGANHVITATYVDTSNPRVHAGSTGTVLQSVNQSNTTVALSASPAQGTRLRAIGLTVHVGTSGAGSGTPTGSVIFTDTTTGTVLGSASLDAAGNATLLRHLGGPLGSHTIQAAYQGDGNFGSSTDTVSVRIIANGTRSTAVVLRSSSNPSVVGSPVTFTATVRDTGPLPRVAPGGSVMFFNRTTGEVLGYAKLVVVGSGITRASLATSVLPIGIHEIDARYSGNAAFARVNSPILEQEVKAVPTLTTSTTLIQSSGSTAFGAPVTFTATVTETDPSTSLTPTGTVTFTYGASNTVLGTGTLTQVAPGVARAILVSGELPVGVHAVRATYSGDTDFAPGAPSSSVTHTVTKAASLLALTSTANPARFGQAVTFRATMTSSTGGGVPTGAVKFFVNGVEIGSGTINAAGVASFTTGSLAVGSYTVTASYAGDSNFNASNGTLAGGQTVNKAATKASLSRSTSEAGAPVTFTATILPVAPGGGVPDGTVTFVINGTNRGTFGMTNGVATLFLPNGLPQGSHKIVVKYSGGTNHLASDTTFILNFGGRAS